MPARAPSSAWSVMVGRALALRQRVRWPLSIVNHASIQAVLGLEVSLHVDGRAVVLVVE